MPQYYNAGLGSNQTDRYNANWFFCFFYVLMIIPPVMSFYTMIVVMIRRPTDDYELQPPSIILYYVVTIVITIILYVSMIYKIVQYVYCGDRNLCRNFNPNGTSSNANYVFLFDLSFSIIFPVLSSIYVALGLVMKNYVTSYVVVKVK